LFLPKPVPKINQHNEQADVHWRKDAELEFGAGIEQCHRRKDGCKIAKNIKRADKGKNFRGWRSRVKKFFQPFEHNPTQQSQNKSNKNNSDQIWNFDQNLTPFFNGQNKRGEIGNAKLNIFRSDRVIDQLAVGGIVGQ